MVFSHTVQFLAENPNRIFVFISQLTDLVSFSGFLFCFGFATWIAYLQGPQRPWGRIFRTILKFYVAYIISGVAFRVLINFSTPGFSLLGNIAALRDTPAYSEFLLAFAVIILLGAVFQRVIVLSTEHWRYLMAATFICLAFTFIPIELPYLPLIGQILGGQGFIAYPAIQYLPLFLLGIYRARSPEHFNRKLTFLIGMAGLLFYILLVLSGVPLPRYPPSIGWILCSAGVFFLYYWLARIMGAKFPSLIQKYLNAVGQNVLAYLLLSNLILFTGHPLGLTKSLSTTQTLVFFILLMSFIYFLQFILVDLKRTNQSIDQKT